MIISEGYRVNSHRGVQFRIWATQVLREYIVKGFALNDSLLKNAGGGNYFDEWLARIREIPRQLRGIPWKILNGCRRKSRRDWKSMSQVRRCARARPCVAVNATGIAQNNSEISSTNFCSLFCSISILQLH